MLDFGWQEFVVIAVVTVIVVGPKELPRVFRTITELMRKARSLAGEFHSAMDEMAREADLADIKKEAQKIKNGSSDWVKEIDPTGEARDTIQDFKSEVNAAKSSVDDEIKKPDPNDFAPSPSATTPMPEVKAASKKITAKKASAKKVSAKKAASKKIAAKKAPTKKASAKKAAAKKASPAGKSDA